MHDGSFLKTSCGSPNYAAPEVITGKLYAGPEVDVWSCGVILFALLCGRLPFDEDSIPSLFKKIREGEYTFPKHVNPLARDLISKILVVDPLERITVDQIKKHPWFVKELPQYLVDDFASHELIHHSIQENKDSQAANMVIDDEVLRQALAKLDILVDRIPMEKAARVLQKAREDVKSGQMNDITVAYSLIMDHKMKTIMREQYQKRSTNGAGGLQQQLVHHWPMIGTSPPVNQVTLEVIMNNKGQVVDYPSSPLTRFILNETTMNRPMSQQQIEQERYLKENMPETLDELIQIDTSEESYKRDDNFRLGIRRSQNTGVVTNKNAMEIMREVYRVLKLMGMKWKDIGPFNIKAKWIDPSMPRMSMGLQVFKTHSDSRIERSLPDSYYMLDIVHTGGNVFHFMDAAYRFRALLQL